MLDISNAKPKDCIILPFISSTVLRLQAEARICLCKFCVVSVSGSVYWKIEEQFLVCQSPYYLVEDEIYKSNFKFRY